ncbi:MAG: VTC domain-containing protein, partial [Clostridia bacterium]|nr:VTC domain-containing protein [Clostridia bacterium]
MLKTEKYRNEWKYLIDTAQKELICKRLEPFLTLDKHAKNGGYMLRSLYFEDYYNSAYEEKDAGVLKRKKYRIRIYDCGDSSIKLERKKKFGAYIFKESASLTKDEVYKILDGDYE